MAVFGTQTLRPGPKAALFCPSWARVIAIGASTGGPAALATLVSQLPQDLSAPVLIVQHMPARFTRLLAERLDTATRLEVREGAEGDPVVPGRIYVAPGGYHMRVARRRSGVCLSLDQGPPINSCRPAVDALFASVADVYGSAAAGAVLTGMGQDGLQGAAAMKSRGASIIVQDQQSSVIWGMPGAIARAGLADEILQLSEIAASLARRTH